MLMTGTETGPTVSVAPDTAAHVIGRVLEASAAQILEQACQQ
jgi:hypothetical protein